MICRKFALLFSTFILLASCNFQLDESLGEVVPQFEEISQVNDDLSSMHELTLDEEAAVAQPQRRTTAVQGESDNSNKNVKSSGLCSQTAVISLASSFAFHSALAAFMYTRNTVNKEVRRSTVHLTLVRKKVKLIKPVAGGMAKPIVEGSDKVLSMGEKVLKTVQKATDEPQLTRGNGVGNRFRKRASIASALTLVYSTGMSLISLSVFSYSLLCHLVPATDFTKRELCQPRKVSEEEFQRILTAKQEERRNEDAIKKISGPFKAVSNLFKPFEGPMKIAQKALNKFQTVIKTLMKPINFLKKGIDFVMKIKLCFVKGGKQCKQAEKPRICIPDKWTPWGVGKAIRGKHGKKCGSVMGTINKVKKKLGKVFNKILKKVEKMGSAVMDKVLAPLFAGVKAVFKKLGIPTGLPKWLKSAFNKVAGLMKQIPSRSPVNKARPVGSGSCNKVESPSGKVIEGPRMEWMSTKDLLANKNGAKDALQEKLKKMKEEEGGQAQYEELEESLAEWVAY